MANIIPKVIPTLFTVLFITILIDIIDKYTKNNPLPFGYNKRILTLTNEELYPITNVLEEVCVAD